MCHFWRSPNLPLRLSSVALYGPLFLKYGSASEGLRLGSPHRHCDTSPRACWGVRRSSVAMTAISKCYWSAPIRLRAPL
jgi:hypothetical protein